LPNLRVEDGHADTLRATLHVIMKALRAISPITAILLGALAEGCVEAETKMSTAEPEGKPQKRNATGVATFGAGCFWCVEATFEAMPGVASVTSGYMGGTTKDPTYEQVCSGTTGHAEVAQVKYDPAVVTYRQLLDMFWRSHDPTTRDRQGADVGSQYRSAVFYLSEEQKKEAEAVKAALKEAKAFGGPIVTQIVPAARFYEAEGYHQDYFRRNASQPYCRISIVPKLRKLKLLR